MSVYFVRNFFIKPFTCVVFNPDCHKKSYGLDYTLNFCDKVTVCNVRIIKVSTIRKWNSGQGLFIDINWATFQSLSQYQLHLGQLVNWLRPYIEQNALYFFILAKSLYRVFKFIGLAFVSKEWIYYKNSKNQDLLLRSSSSNSVKIYSMKQVWLRSL